MRLDYGSLAEPGGSGLDLHRIQVAAAVRTRAHAKPYRPGPIHLETLKCGNAIFEEPPTIPQPYRLLGSAGDSRWQLKRIVSAERMRDSSFIIT